MKDKEIKSISNRGGFFLWVQYCTFMFCFTGFPSGWFFDMLWHILLPWHCQGFLQLNSVLVLECVKVLVCAFIQVKNRLHCGRGLATSHPSLCLYVSVLSFLPLFGLVRFALLAWMLDDQCCQRTPIAFFSFLSMSPSQDKSDLRSFVIQNTDTIWPASHSEYIQSVSWKFKPFPYKILMELYFDWLSQTQLRL